MVKRLKLGVLISGSGTNLQALIDACNQSDFPAEIVLVLSNKNDAYGLTRAQEAKIPTEVLSHRDFVSRELFDQAMHELLTKHGVEFVCLAGFMRLLSPWFVRAWHNKMVNIHPSLLPAFKGIHAQQQALDYGVKVTGCTVHFVREEMDVGPIIMQRALSVRPEDTVATLTSRLLEQEHHCYVDAIRLIASGKTKIIDEKVVLL